MGPASEDGAFSASRDSYLASPSIPSERPEGAVRGAAGREGAPPIALSIVIPVFDEAEGIADLCDEILAALGSCEGMEIIVVDDCSTDDTLPRLIAWRRARAAPLRLLRHEHNRGQSAALHSGVRAARGEWIATLDGDGQNDPVDIPVLAGLARDAPDNARLLVCGHRVDRHDSRTRRLASRIANAVRAAVLRDATPDTGCGLKVMRRASFLELPYFDHMHRFLPALVRQAGGRSVSVPVRHRPRRFGQSKYGINDRLWAGLIDLLGVAWLGRRRRPVNLQEIEDR